jgi:hypothetical protein
VGPSKVVDLLISGRELEAVRNSFAGDSDTSRDDTERVDLMLGLGSGSGDEGGDRSSAGAYLWAYGLEVPVLVLDRGCGRELRAWGCCLLCTYQSLSPSAKAHLRCWPLMLQLH